MLFFCHYEKIWLSECPSQFKPVVYRRYIDDIYVLFKSTEHLKHFVNHINSKHKTIKFTFKTKDSNNFSFLDVKITLRNKRFVASIFRKATFSGVFTNYDRFSPHASVLVFQYSFLYGKFSYRSRTPEKYFEM